MKKTVTTLALGISLIAASHAYALNITAMDSADNLTQSLVGSGITISNVQYNGASNASGYFTNGSESGIGIESGIVLTTGSAANLNGTQNNSSSTTSVNFLGGNDHLNNLVNGASTYDATTLEFDFVSNGDSAYFNYVFGSEEYLEWVDAGFNDVFGFFLDDTNLAVVPGTDGTAVSIDNINDKRNSNYYNDNAPSYFGAVSDFGFEYDGFTDVFTASATGLTAGQSYHLTLAIADVGDYSWDSGVFLEAGSFTDTFDDRGSEPVPEPATIFLFGTGLCALGIYGRRNKKSSEK